MKISVPRGKRHTAWLTKDNCAALRGLAILAIALHNYCHWLGPAVKENEYTFTAAKAQGMWQALACPDGWLPIHLVSFFGHYGVPVFLFLSGFGLVMKYERMERLPVWRFIRYHYLKLFGMMVVGFAIFTVVDLITPGSFHYRAGNVLAQLAMCINLLPRPDRLIWPGPYWFFGLMMQLYIIYRLLFFRRHWGFVIGAVVLCWVVQAVQSPTGEVLNSLRYNCVGGVLPFGAGVILGRMTRDGRLDALAVLSRWAWLGVAVAFSVLVLLMSMSYQLWFWVPLVVIVASVAAVKALPAGHGGWLVWVGHVSAAMFVLHPVLRKVFIPLSRRDGVYDGLVLYIVATLCLSWVLKMVLDKVQKPRL